MVRIHLKTTLFFLFLFALCYSHGVFANVFSCNNFSSKVLTPKATQHQSLASQKHRSVSCQTTKVNGIDDLLDELNDEDDEKENKLSSDKKLPANWSNCSNYFYMQAAAKSTCLFTHHPRTTLSFSSFKKPKYLVFCVFRI